jgi:hypothetical protein
MLGSCGQSQQAFRLGLSRSHRVQDPHLNHSHIQGSRSAFPAPAADARRSSSVPCHRQAPAEIGSLIHRSHHQRVRPPWLPSGEYDG